MTLPSIASRIIVRNKPVPFRLRVLRALTALIERVNPDNGFHHDLRGNVYRGRLRFSEEDPQTMVSILEAPIPQEGIPAPGSNPNAYSVWELLVQGWTEDDRTNPSDPAHFLMAEVKQVLAQAKVDDIGYGSNILGMGGRITEIGIGQGTVRPPDDPSTEAFFWLTVNLRIGEALDRPYT